MTGLELWGGIECTIARIGGRYRDQLAETGHHDRIGDLDLIAELGIQTLRYPVLWEAVSPGSSAQGRGWSWHDARLSRLRELGVEPILGLLHHGSGPPDTHLLDPSFPARLAEHAARVAERYPWVKRYTPVNEPLTTARFSALYGHWYPHRRSYPDFLRALVNQCRATVLAMAEIRKSNPDAELVQTEDIGRIFSTDKLAYQAAHENERRWLSLDLLFGRVTPDHPFWPRLRECGIAEDELRSFEGVRPPDIVGINHYLTSDRYLDEALERYPPSLYGSNGRHRYADAEAVRIPHLPGQVGPLARIREVAARYGAPIAVTEAHHGCSRDEQLRWLCDVWAAAEAARREGLDVRAVTIWSMLGANDWNSLLTRDEGTYEPGAFDVRGRQPRPTALAHAARALAGSGKFDHPVLARPGWWGREDRFYGIGPQAPAISRGSAPAIVLVGAPAAFGIECLRIAHHRGLELDLVRDARDRQSLDGSRPAPWAIVDASGLAPAPGACNEGLLSWLKAAQHSGLRCCFLSRSDVFEARSGHAAVEGDLPSPVSEDGRRRAAQEEAFLAHRPGGLVIRAGRLFGPGADHVGTIREARAAQEGKAASAAGRFSYVPDLVHAIFDLLLDEEEGIRHLVNGEALGTAIRRCGATTLATTRGVIMPSLGSALAREADRRREAWDAGLQAAE